MLTLAYPFDVTIPAGTSKASPLVTRTTFDPNTVERIEWTFPEGCQGMVGVAIGARNVPVLPPVQGGFFIRSGSTQGFDLSDMHDSGDWSVIGYNLGSFPHTIHVVFKVHRKVAPESPTVLIIDGPIMVGSGES